MAGYKTRNHFYVAALVLCVWALTLDCSSWVAGADVETDPLNQFHIPIGIPNSVDTLKTFVEAEGSFSPGFASYGVYVWLRDSTGRLYSPVQKESGCAHGLAAGGLLIPWSSWKAGSVEVRTEVCQVLKKVPTGEVQVVGLRIELVNRQATARKVQLFVAIRAHGPAGWPIKAMSVDSPDTLRVDGNTALVADRKADAIGVAGKDCTGILAADGNVPELKAAVSDDGNCSGAMRFDVELAADGHSSIGVFCPVLSGRRAVGHNWKPGGSNNNFKETAVYNPVEGGVLQPDPGAEWCRGLKIDEVFAQAAEYWRGVTGRVKVDLPDKRWGEGFAAMAGHIAMNFNEDAPDVSVINYTTYNRDGMYNTEVMHQSGLFELAEKAIDYLYAHPFNGRIFPEADNPGQILWVTGQHWLYTRDEAWLKRVMPNVKKLAALIQYSRKTPVPHWVDMDSLDFGDAAPVERRKELKPGACDGFNPNYTEAYDIAGLRAASLLCKAAGDEQQSAGWSTLADELMSDYDGKYGSNLGKGYGSYSVLWPCRLYSLENSKAIEQFSKIGAQQYASWPYFGPARSHQGLLAGNRAAGHGTLAMQLDHPQMQSWYAFDEGGASGEGGWMAPLPSSWKKSRAMPHGWAIAEVTLLLRDCLAFEDKDRLVLFAGIPGIWFADSKGMSVANLPTYFGRLGFEYKYANGEGSLDLTGTAQPPAGFVLCLPAEKILSVVADGKEMVRGVDGRVLLPKETRKVIVK